jgi:archaellum component FlaC
MKGQSFKIQWKGSIMKLLTTVCLSLCIATSAFANGKLEEARSKFFGEAQSLYQDILKNLEAKNFEAAKKSADDFKAQLVKIDDNFLDIEDKIKALDPEPQKIWREFYGSSGPWRELNINAGGLQTKIGVSNFDSVLDKVKETYVKCGDQINKMTEAFKEYGKQLEDKVNKMREICDSCK